MSYTDLVYSCAQRKKGESAGQTCEGWADFDHREGPALPDLYANVSPAAPDFKFLSSRAQQWFHLWDLHVVCPLRFVWRFDIQLTNGVLTTPYHYAHYCSVYPPWYQTKKAQTNWLSSQSQALPDSGKKVRLILVWISMWESNTFPEHCVTYRTRTRFKYNVLFTTQWWRIWAAR